jgi:hypothetical protein
MQLSEIEPGLWLYSDQQAGMESYCHGLAECINCGGVDTDRTKGDE